ncbi:MAG: hypothetical protein K0R15_1717 [Clostridiales bacterium]|nr:hypothetical protein [Clostridiales bacterium]
MIAIVSTAALFNKQNNQLVYEYKQSYHTDFYIDIDNSYVVFESSIKVKNTTSKDLDFYMSADVSEDFGLVSEYTAIACNKDTLDKKVFIIKANSEQSYIVYFKAKKGEKDTKLNRI